MVILELVLAVLLSLLITPAAIKMGILDKPNYRKIHDKPIPKGGGIGIFIPVIILELMNFLFFRATITLDVYKFFTILLVTFTLMILGIIDDKYDLGSNIKLFIQIILTLLTLGSGIRFHTFDIMVLDLLLTAVWIIGIINAVNLIDGLDGLAAGIAIISCAGFSVIGYAFGSKTIVMLSLLLIGGCLGFLKYNFRPARIFMGDTGSVPLGYNLAILGILCENAISGNASILIPVIMVGVPIYDTLLTVTRRAFNHKPIFLPDRSHFYNLMIDLKGVEHKWTVLIIYGFNIVLVTISSLLAFSGDIWRIVSTGIIIFAVCLLSKRLGFIRTDELSEK